MGELASQGLAAKQAASVVEGQVGELTSQGLAAKQAASQGLAAAVGGGTAIQAVKNVSLKKEAKMVGGRILKSQLEFLSPYENRSQILQSSSRKSRKNNRHKLKHNISKHRH